MKVTIAFSNDELYRAVRVRAAQGGRQIRDIVEEALEMWLTAQEDAEDVAASASALAEPGKSADAEAFFAKMVAEGGSNTARAKFPWPTGVLLRPAAERELDRLRGAQFVAIRGVILALSDEPRPRGAIKLSGSENLWRVRIRVDGKPWRVIYQLNDETRVVVVTRVVRRDEGTYHRLKSQTDGNGFTSRRS